MTRIALIHAGLVSMPPMLDAFARHWPEAELLNLLDDRLSEDRAGDGVLTPAMTTRLLALARYAVASGAQGILFTCSAFGPAIEACAAALAPLPVLKPNQAMVEAALAAGGSIALLATFPGTLQTMPDEFPAGTTLHPQLIEGAFAALLAGDLLEHDRLAAATARRCTADVIALAQASLSRAAPAVAAATGKRVLTTPDTAVAKLRGLLSAR